jgi:hypothetical protein
MNLMTAARCLVIYAGVVATSGCESAGAVRALQQPSNELKNASGAIVAVRPDAGWWGIVPDADRGTRYAPDRLPDEFKIDGLRVSFSGHVKPVDPNVRVWGVPFELTAIRRE